jgi:hypothetical protein
MGINLYSHVFFNFKARSDYEICGTKRTAVSSEWAGDVFMLVYLTMPTSDDLATSVPAISAGAAEATAREVRAEKKSLGKCISLDTWSFADWRERARPP